MSLRQSVETLIRDRVQAVAPHLAGDLWGRMRLTVTFPRIDAKSAGALTGEAEAWLIAERFDDLPVDALIAALRQPMQDAASGIRLRLTGWREEAGEMAVTGRLVFTVDFLLGE